MSGILGVLGINGQNPDPTLLSQLTHSMAFRGPDAQHSWVGQGIGLGHALLSTSPEANIKQQPLSLDGQVWIIADARLDARSELLSALRSAGQDCCEPVWDAELILRAYCAWGERCLDRFLGDFCFSIWDGPRRFLFCAHDQLGVKPFYYAETKEWMVFGNTLDTIRMHPGVSSKLNEMAVADFLLFGFNQDSDTTTFADIHRLPPAHSVTWCNGKLELKRYWSFPVDLEVRYKDPAEYEEGFRDLLQTVVRDRVRGDRAAISLSGGLDSSSIAACARCVGIADLQAFTVVYDKVMPNDERHYAGLVAQHLALPIKFFAADDYVGQTKQVISEEPSPEPNENALIGFERDFYQMAGAASHVLISGEGGDAALSPSNSHFRRLLRAGHLRRLLRDGMRYAKSARGLPPMGVRTALKRRLGLFNDWHVDYPEWLNPDFEARLRLREQWNATRARDFSHPHRPEAVDALQSILWQNFLESADPGVTRVPMAQVYPYMDLRLLRFLFSIPPVPWTVDKYLIRSSMRGILPEDVRVRPKTPLVDDPSLIFVRNNQKAFSKALSNIAAYVDSLKYEAFLKSPAAFSRNNYQFCVRPALLSGWLNSAIGFHGN